MSAVRYPARRIFATFSIVFQLRVDEKKVGSKKAKVENVDGAARTKQFRMEIKRCGSTLRIAETE
jgi:hypothetical protein